jgi:tetratricopeptide (TPR) repeat protein
VLLQCLGGVEREGWLPRLVATATGPPRVKARAVTEERRHENRSSPQREGLVSWALRLVISLAVIAAVGFFFYSAWRQHGDPVPSLKRIHYWVDVGQVERAAAAIEHYLKLMPGDPDVLLLAARIQAAQGNLKEAMELLEKIPPRSPLYVEALLRRGQLYRELSWARQAERLFREVIRVAGSYEIPELRQFRRLAIFELIALYSLEHRPEEAIPLVWEVYPEHTEPWRLLIALARLQGEPPHPERAVQLLEKAAEQDPQDAISRRAIAWYSLKRGDPEGAIRWAHEALKLQPKDKEALATLFQAYQRLGQTEKIAQWLKSRELLEQPSAELLRAIGGAYEAMGQLDEAERYFRKALELAPFGFDMHFAVGTVLTKKRQLEEGKAFLVRFQELKKHYDSIQQWLGSLGEDAQAATWTVPEPPQCVQLAEHCWALGRYREARCWAEVALAQAPGFEPAQRFLDQNPFPPPLNHTPSTATPYSAPATVPVRHR